jgi:hypothetical protein
MRSCSGASGGVSQVFEQSSPAANEPHTDGKIWEQIWEQNAVKLAQIGATRRDR